MATIKQRKAAEKILENHGNVSKAMKEVGYAETTAQTPGNLTDSKGWQELMDEYLSDEDLAKAHNELLRATHIEHMVFPVAMTDAEITELLLSVNCKPRKFQHGDTANHVWFWAKDNNALKNGLDLAYKLKGKYAPLKLDPFGDSSLFDEAEFSIKVTKRTEVQPEKEAE
jgi:hypothetical protein